MTAGAGRTVISLGGSLVVPDGVDTAFLRAFKEIIEARIAAGEKFVIIVGGGKTARTYITAGQQLADFSSKAQDWLGIYATRFNAEFVRLVFGDLAYERVVIDPDAPLETEKPIIFGAGVKPGQSTDAVAVALAKNAGARKVLNLSNINYVYDKDPKANPDAVALKSLTWSQYRTLIPAEWQPGLSTPFDPTASKEAEAIGLEVMILNGSKLDEVRKCLAGEPFDGSVIG